MARGVLETGTELGEGKQEVSWGHSWKGFPGANAETYGMRDLTGLQAALRSDQMETDEGKPTRQTKHSDPSNANIFSSTEREGSESDGSALPYYSQIKSVG